ncbi:MAG: DUF2306 domain-containing protein [Dinoroseobacter sp.]|nr:DUF2306 domain-containing protein [Dinoroseobacter sp.]
MTRSGVIQRVGLAVLCLLVLPFVIYALGFGWRGLTRDLSEETYLWRPEAPGPTNALMVHMIAGAVITLLVPLQAALGVSRRAPEVHRFMGRCLVVASLVTAFGGLWYIAHVGTIGGQLMDVGFTFYGALMLLAALKLTLRAWEKDWSAHRDWALRLVVLALASWMFRVHYGLWFLLTGGVRSQPDLRGIFDQVQVFAFYVPYLLALELWLRRRRA